MRTGVVLRRDMALDDLLRARVPRGANMGIAAGTVGPDGTRAIGPYGQAGEGRRRVAADSVFEIGSAEKVFTGTLLADVVERAEVALTDPISEFLPSSVTMPSWEGHPMRLVDLATHTSGLPRLPTNLSIPDPGNPLADYTVKQLYPFLPSTRWRETWVPRTSTPTLGSDSSATCWPCGPATSGGSTGVSGGCGRSRSTPITSSGMSCRW